MMRRMLVIWVLVAGVAALECRPGGSFESATEDGVRSTPGPCGNGATTNVEIRDGVGGDCSLDPPEPYDAYVEQAWCFHNNTTKRVKLKTEDTQHGVYLFTEDITKKNGRKMNEWIEPGGHLRVWVSGSVRNGDEYPEQKLVDCKRTIPKAGATFKIVNPVLPPGGPPPGVPPQTEPGETH